MDPLDPLRTRYPDVRLALADAANPFSGPWQVVAVGRIRDDGSAGTVRGDGRPFALGRGPTPGQAIKDAVMRWKP